MHLTENAVTFFFSPKFWKKKKMNWNNLLICILQEVKIDKWDGSAVKNALDDAVKEVFIRKYNYVENFALMDGRLALCGLAVCVAIVALLWDFFYPFPTSKPVLVACVSTYFVLMGILTLYITYKEKGIFVVAIQR